MSRKTIPAKTIITCDRCKTINQFDFTGFEPQLEYTRKDPDPIDGLGEYRGTIDLCTKCAKEFAEFMNGGGK